MSSNPRAPRSGMPAGPRANPRSIARVLREVAFFLQLKGAA